jgi:hypothetical protein
MNNFLFKYYSLGEDNQVLVKELIKKSFQT